MGLLQQAAEEVAAAIGGEVDYVPEFELKDFAQEKIIVLPTGERVERKTRDSLEIEVMLEIGIGKRIKEDEVPVMLAQVSQIKETVLNLRVFERHGFCSEIINVPAYNVALMAAEKRFFTVLEVTYKVIQ